MDDKLLIARIGDTIPAGAIVREIRDGKIYYEPSNKHPVPVPTVCLGCGQTLKDQWQSCKCVTTTQNTFYTDEMMLKQMQNSPSNPLHIHVALSSTKT